MIRAVLLGLLLSAAPLRADPVGLWLAAQELATLARAERDAILLASAARQQALAEAEDGSLAQAPRNAATLLEEARVLAGRDPVASAVVQRYAGLTPRGSPGGTALQILALAPGEEARVVRTFRAGQAAIVYSEAPAPFRLSVENGASAALCQRRLAEGAALCRWVPTLTGSVTIRVINESPQPSRVAFITN